MTEGGALSVVLATDGSDLANRALIAGLRVVAPGGRLLLVTVVPGDDPSLVVGTGHSGPVMTPDEKREMRQSDDAAGRAVLDAAACLLAPTEAEPRLLHGDPGRAICRCADEVDADVIVIGTRGLGGLKRAVLGSVSDHVVRHAPCAVLTVGDA